MMGLPCTARWALVITLVCAGMLRAEEPRVYTPRPGELPDANGDGLPDVDNILRQIDHLATVGVKFDDECKDGNVPNKNAKDGKYHLACVDLLNIAYRAAGYDIPSSMSGGPLLGKNDPKKLGSGSFRQIDNVVPWLMRNPNFHYFRTPEINLVANQRWRPRVPFKIGDMVFVHYDDANDRHSGIVTGVDPATGRPTHITNCSIYNENQGLHRATIDEFFSLKCRMLSGYARPASWDGDPITDPVKLGPPVKEIMTRTRKTHGTPEVARAAPRRRSRSFRRNRQNTSAPVGTTLAASGAR